MEVHTKEATIPVDRLDRVSKIISSASMWAAGAGLIPIPIVDIGALAAIQVNMAGKIAALYGQSFRDEPLRATITVLLGTLLPSAGTSVVSSGLKAIPGFGTVLGMLTFPALGSASTYAMGRVLVRHFEGGGSASNFTVNRVRNDLHKEFAATETKPV